MPRMPPADPAPVPPGLEPALRRAVLTAVAAATAVSIGFLAAAAPRAWVLHRSRLPRPSVVVLLAAYAAVAAGCRRGWLRRAWPWPAVALLGALYITHVAYPLGDHDQRVRDMRRLQLAASEPVAQLVYSRWFRAGLDADLLPPLAGVAAGAMFLSLLGRLSRDPQRLPAWLPGALWAGSAFHLVFFRGFVETTSLSILPVLAFVAFALDYLRTPVAPLRRLVAPSSWVALGILVHGQVAFLAPVWPLTVLLKERGAGGRRLAGALGMVAAAAAATGAAVLALVAALGYRVVPGNIEGGGDTERLVPLGTPFASAGLTLLSVSHLVRIGNILAAAAPWLVLLGIGRGLAEVRERPREPDVELFFLGLLSLAYLGFVTLWNFDLAFPGDYDLMTTLSVVVQLYVFVLLDRWPRPRPWLLAVVSLLAGLSSWSLVAPFVRRA